MPSRSVRRRRHKAVARLCHLSPPRRDSESARRLIDWRREADRRTRDGGAPPVWDLARDPTVRATAEALDPGGELQADLDRICAEAVAREAGGCLVKGSRPLADRCRLLGPDSAK